MPIEWGSKYALGIKTVDEQHIKLFEQINNLEKSAREGNSRAAVGKVVEELLLYTMTHFSDEEGMLRAVGYPEYELHLKEHQNLIGQVREFKESYDAGKSVMTAELMGFLVNWLTNHIDKTDRKYVPFFHAPGARAGK